VTNPRARRESRPLFNGESEMNKTKPKMPPFPAVNSKCLTLNVHEMAMITEALNLMAADNDEELNRLCLLYQEASDGEWMRGGDLEPTERNARLVQLGFITFDQWRMKRLTKRFDEALTDTVTPE
jgi:hypothetical protein